MEDMVPEDYLQHDFTDIKTPLPIDRREFLKRMGGGIIVILAISDFLDANAEVLQQRPMPEDPNVYLRVKEDGRVNCYTGKIEMGQGVITSLAQMLADELDVALESVDMILGDTDLCPWDMGTFGSMSTRFFGPPLRAAGAEARGILLQLASKTLELKVDQLAVDKGIVYSKNNRSVSVTYADLTKGKNIVRILKTKPPLKKPSEFKVMGKPVLKQDSDLKVTGKAVFAGDVRLEGMLYARIVRPPAHGAEKTSVDVSEAEEIPGIVIINDHDLLAALHAHPEMADKGAARIKVNYNIPESEVNDKTIFNYIVNHAPEGDIVDQGGDVAKADNSTIQTIEKEYLNSYVAHAPMEPHVAIADFKDGKIDIWASTQTPFRAKDQVAELLNISTNNVRVRQAFVGGGFGGKSTTQQILEAAWLTKLAGKPVQVAWTRREEFFYDTFRPAAVVRIKSSIDKSGKISLWEYGVYAAGERGARHFYDIPNHKTTVFGSGWRGSTIHPLNTGAWRAPANNTNTFARESQIDIMAAVAGADPVEFRLRNLKDKRMIRTLEAVADRVNWSPKVSPSGRGYGVSCGIDAGSYVAHIAEVVIDKKTGKVQVKKVTCAQDMGLTINPQGATIQVEGCITMGLGYALTEEIQFEGGKVMNRNFDSYALPRFSWTPEIDTVLLNLPEEPAQGGGEPAIICMGAVIANAIFDASGVRLYQLPMTPERVLNALSEI
jgi:isoquinoline 1-oxidoreductase